MMFTLIPVSSSQSGPEKFCGPSACRPASQNTLISVPAYCLASRTAISAALSAQAALDPTPSNASAVSPPIIDRIDLTAIDGLPLFGAVLPRPTTIL